MAKPKDSGILGFVGFACLLGMGFPCPALPHSRLCLLEAPDPSSDLQNVASDGGKGWEMGRAYIIFCSLKTFIAPVFQSMVLCEQDASKREIGRREWGRMGEEWLGFTSHHIGIL